MSFPGWSLAGWVLAATSSLVTLSVAQVLPASLACFPAPSQAAPELPQSSSVIALATRLPYHESTFACHREIPSPQLPYPTQASICPG